MSEAPTSALQPTQDEDTTTSRPDVVQMAIELSHCWDLNVKTESFCVEVLRLQNKPYVATLPLGQQTLTPTPSQ